MKSSDDCYDHPGYWDLAFSDETRPEADFIDAALQKYRGPGRRRLLEYGCGGGRQVMELTRRGHDVTAIDLNETCIRFATSRVRRAGRSAHIRRHDMTCPLDLAPFDLAHCLVNTFRHLTSESAARNHLLSVAAALRPGGVYLLGLHLMPPDASEWDCERWTVSRGTTRVTATIRVLDFSRRRRLETVRFCLRVRTPTADLKLRTDHSLRIYRADQIVKLLKSVPQLRLVAVHDFCYDITQPLPLNDELGDTVLILQRT